jgi:thermostable 8-oxoguanine DNA glycosylase
MNRSRIDKDILAHGRDYIRLIAGNAEMKARYGARPRASQGHVRNAIMFGILTANERYEAAEKALYMIAPLEWSAPLQDSLRFAGIIFWRQKAQALESFRADFDLNPTPYHPQPNESCSEYRDRLYDMNIPGLGFVKTSFAAYLAYGGGNVICADRHILNLYTEGHFEQWMHKRSPKAHKFIREVEEYFVTLAEEYQWPSASALQWAVWAEAIGADDVTHSPVSDAI